MATASDFESGTLKNLSLRADGRIFLAPEFTEIFDSSTPYLWTLAADSKGNLYTAGGGTGSGTAKVFVIDRDGKSRPFAELDGLEIHAIVLDGKDEVYAATDPTARFIRSAPTASRSCSTIRTRNISGPWRSIARAICSSPPAIKAKFIASALPELARSSLRPRRPTPARSPSMPKTT